MSSAKQPVSLPENDEDKLGGLATRLVTLFEILEPLHKAEYTPRIQTGGRFRELSSLVIESYRMVISHIEDATSQISNFCILLHREGMGAEDHAQLISDQASGIFGRYLDTQVTVENIRRRLNKVLKALILESTKSPQKTTPGSFANIPIPLQIDQLEKEGRSAVDSELSPTPRLTEGKSINDILSLVYRVNNILDEVEDYLVCLQNGWSDVCAELGDVGAAGLVSLHTFEPGQHWVSYVNKIETVKRLLHSAVPIQEKAVVRKPQAFMALSTDSAPDASGDPGGIAALDNINMADLIKYIKDILEPRSYTPLTQSSQVPWKEMLEMFIRTEGESLETAKKVHESCSRGSDLCASMTQVPATDRTQGWKDMSIVAKDTQEECTRTFKSFRDIYSSISQSPELNGCEVPVPHRKRTEPSNPQFATASAADVETAPPAEATLHMFSVSDFQTLYYVIITLRSWWNGIHMKSGTLISQSNKPAINITNLRVQIINSSWTTIKNATGDYQEKLKDIDLQPKLEHKDVNGDSKEKSQPQPQPKKQGPFAFLRKLLCCF